MLRSAEETYLAEKITSLRIDENTKKNLESLSEKYALSQSEIIRRLISLCCEYHFFESNWKDQFLEDQIKFYEEKEKIRLNTSIKEQTYIFDMKEASKDKDRKLQKQLALLGQYFKTRTDSEKRLIFDRQFDLQKALSGETDVHYSPSKSKEGYIVSINGKSLQVKELLENGFPKLEFNQERLVQCDRGFHTKNSWCPNCDSVTSCVILRNERIESLSK